MSRAGDSTRDWLLKKLLKASRALQEQQVQIATLKEIAEGRDAAYRDLFTQREELREQLVQAIDLGVRQAKRVDDMEFELQQLKKVPPIAPNLTVIENPSHKRMEVLSVANTKGTTTITVARARSQD